MIVGGHITELFDHWDHTLETGTEIDFAVVLVAAAGASVLLAVAAAELIVRALRRLFKKLTDETEESQFFASPSSIPTSSPPLSLRI
jgi:hypothetical protein